MTELTGAILYNERLRNAFICFHYYNEVPRVVYLMKKGIYSACGFKGYKFKILRPELAHSRQS